VRLKAERVKSDFAGIKVLAVDLVGTLTKKVNTTFAARGSEHLAKNGYEIEPATFRRLYRKRYLEYTMGNYANDREFYSALAFDLSIEEWDPWLQSLTDLWTGYSTPFGDSQPFLEQVTRTHRIILSSNYVAEWAQRVVAGAHWEGYFHGHVISSECRFRKPSRQFFREVVKVSGVTFPQEVLVIGDSLANDVYGATHAGLRAAFVARSAGTRESEYPKTVPGVRSLLELVPYLTGEQAVAAEPRP
jgi:HAD superfamily hydrolase (TIGR01549 family)